MRRASKTAELPALKDWAQTLALLIGVLCLVLASVLAQAQTTTTTTTSSQQTDDLSDLEEIEAEEISSSDVKEIRKTTTEVRQPRTRTVRRQARPASSLEVLDDPQARIIIDEYEDNPSQFMIVEEEIIEEEAETENFEREQELEQIVREVQYQNYRIELATQGMGKELGDAQLTAESKKRLDRVALLLNGFPRHWKSASLRGYSNLYDSSQANMELSHRRAFMAHHYLSRKGVDQRKVALRAFARKKPEKSDQNILDRQNRIIFLHVNSVLAGTLLDRELRKIEEEPLNVVVIQPVATKTEVIYKDRVVYKEAKPKVIYKPIAPKTFKVSIEGIGSNFRTADDALNQGARERLKRLAILLDLHKGQWKDISVEGHADERGGYQYNMDLSGRRAQSVLQILQREGVDRKKISSRAFGYTKPLVERSNAYGWQKNRRVEVLISGVTEGSALSKALRQLIIPK